MFALKVTLEFVDFLRLNLVRNKKVLTGSFGQRLLVIFTVLSPFYIESLKFHLLAYQGVFNAICRL